MSRTANASGDSKHRDGATETPTLRTLVADAVSGSIEKIVYRENVGTLAEREEEWHRFETASALPEQHVSGWDELYVYTDTHVYRWVGVGFDSGPERLPRDPSVLPGEA